MSPKFLAPSDTRQILGNPCFWARAYAYAPSDAAEWDIETSGWVAAEIDGQHPDEWFEDAALKVSEHFDAFEALIAEHAREEHTDEDDPELYVELLSIPIWLPGGYLWEIELYDNGEDAGTSYYLHGPGLERRLEIGVLDAHFRLPILRWPELEQLLSAMARDERNRASGAVGVGLLLFWATVDLTKDDPVDEIRARLESEWRESGLVTPEHATTLAAEAPTASAWERHPELGWLRNERSYSYRRAKGGWDGAGFTAFNRFLDVIAKWPR